MVSGLFSRNAPRLIPGAATEGHVKLVTSSVLVEELAEVISREKFAHMLTEQKVKVRALLNRHATLAERLTPSSIRRAVIDDADDDHVLACALAARADLIVTGMRIYSA